MPKKPTKKCQFQSRYAHETYLSAHQFLAERVCMNIAARDNKILPYQFWKLPEWEKIFKFQCILASRLLKKYPFEIINKVLETNEAHNCFSLGASWLLNPILDRELKKSKNTNYDVSSYNEEAKYVKPGKFVPKSRRIEQ